MTYRINPVGPPEAYKTYTLLQPVASHFRVATCAEVECEHHAYGWKTLADVTTADGAARARYIVDHSGRSYTWAPALGDHGVVAFMFPPGQQCFDTHRVPLEREPVAVVRGGDWRGNPRGTPVRRHVRLDDWVDDFATHQIDVAERVERG